jgi:hypothetical protein
LVGRNSNLQWSAFAYFLIACVVIVGSAVSWAFFERLPIVQHYIESAGRLIYRLYHIISICYNYMIYGVCAAASQAERVSLNPQKSDLGEKTKLLSSSDESSVMSIFRRIRTPAFAVWLTFAVTLSVFPAGNLLQSHSLFCLSQPLTHFHSYGYDDD